MKNETSAQSRIILGSCTYDLKNEHLEDPTGRRVHLRPQSADVLKVMVQRADAVVSKDDLVTLVWPDVSVTDDSIVQCVADIRRAIGDIERQVLRTVPKRGYRLVLRGEIEIHGSGGGQDATAQAVPSTASEAHIGDPRDACVFARIERLLVEGEMPAQMMSRMVENWDIADRGGRVKGASADGIPLVFSDAERAITAAESIRSWWHAHCRSAAPDDQVILRVGADLSPPHGGGERTAAELAKVGGPGDITATAAIRDASVGELVSEFVDLGDKTFPGLATSTRCFKVVPRESETVLRPLLSPEDILPTIAVIPFVPRNGEIDKKVLGDVLADDVISLLSRSFEVNVISRLSTTGLAYGKASLSEMGAALQTDFVLSGRFFDRSNRFEVEVELAEVETGRILWADHYDCKTSNVLDDTGLIEWIVTRVQRAMFSREVARVRSHALPTLKNYSLLMSAVAFMHRLSPTDFSTARVLLETLIERAPNLPAPLAWMARWHVLRVQQGWSEEPLKDAHAALECTKRALDIDPDNVLAMVAEGFVLTNLLHRLDEAEDLYDTALESSPNDAVGRLLRGTLFAFRGDGERAMRDTERSLHLTPLDPLRFFFLSLSASACIAAKEYERALQLSKLSLRANRTHTSTLRVRAVAQMRLGQEESAKNTAQELLKLQPNLRVRDWLDTSPSRDFEVGRGFAQTLKEIGIPD